MAKKEKLIANDKSGAIAYIYNIMTKGAPANMVSTLQTLGSVTAQVELTKHMYNLNDSIHIKKEESITQQVLMDISIYAGLAAACLGAQGVLPFLEEATIPSRIKKSKGKPKKGVEYVEVPTKTKEVAPATAFDPLTKADLGEILRKLGRGDKIPPNLKKISREILIEEIKKSPQDKVAVLITKMGKGINKPEGEKNEATPENKKD